jgi:hypothetical protein
LLADPLEGADLATPTDPSYPRDPPNPENAPGETAETVGAGMVTMLNPLIDGVVVGETVEDALKKTDEEDVGAVVVVTAVVSRLKIRDT